MRDEIISEDMPELSRALRAIKGIESRSGGGLTIGLWLAHKKDLRSRSSDG